MEYSLYKLSFTTPLHIGKDSGGASLDNSQKTIHEDTLFAALCCEGVKSRQLEPLVEYFRSGALVMSDALPYSDDNYYLPKPILYSGNKRAEGDSSIKKALKNLEFIPMDLLQEFIKNFGQSELDVNELSQTFGQLTTNTRVAVKGNIPPLPYHVTSWRFIDNCGLYIILGYEKQEALVVFEELLENLGWSGVGGKQSSGWGKFAVKKVNAPALLQEMLTDDQAEYQMLLGTALPVDQELKEILQDGWYMLVRRGGFIRSETYAVSQLKKRTIYMLGPGSCLRRRFKGGMYDLSDNGGHPVWRCGNSLFAGVNL